MAEAQLLSREVAAAYLGVSPCSLWRRTRVGGLPFVRLGSRILFRRSDLEKLVDANLVVLEKPGSTRRRSGSRKGARA